MAKMPRILRRRPEIDEAEFERVRMRTLDRLQRIRGGADDVPEPDPDAGDGAPGDMAGGAPAAVAPTDAPAGLPAQPANTEDAGDAAPSGDAAPPPAPRSRSRRSS